MKRKSTPVGALHPILFFAGVYVVVLMFSIFICSTIFYSCNSVKTGVVEKTTNNNATAVASIK
jgi:hypothetical protein